jgi:hypothetical protein
MLSFGIFLIIVNFDVIQAKFFIFIKGSWAELNFESGIFARVEGVGDERMR